MVHDSICIHRIAMFFDFVMIRINKSWLMVGKIYKGLYESFLHPL